jgi:hypothetical protein
VRKLKQGVVQGTTHRVVDDETFRQRTMIMSAERADGEYTQARPHKNDVIVINLACDGLTIGEIPELESGLEVWHLLIIHCRIQYLLFISWRAVFSRSEPGNSSFQRSVDGAGMGMNPFADQPQHRFEISRGCLE